MKANLAISKAKIKLYDLTPFFADLVFIMGAQEATWTETAATDGEYLYYNAKFIEKLDKKEVIGVLLHEVLHAALGHVWRRETRDPLKWNLATDFAVNAIIHQNHGINLPEGHLYDPKYVNMSAEEIYDKLKTKTITISCPFCGGTGKGGGQGDNKKNKGGKGGKSKQQNADGKGNYCPHCSHSVWGKTDKNMNKAKMKKLQKKWEMAMREAVKSRGDTPEGMERYVKALDAKEDWKQILTAFLSNSKSDFDFMVRDRRTMYNPFYLPDLRDEEDLRDVVIVFDTSGSISEEDLNVYFSETKEIISSFPNVQGWVTDCDCEVYSFEPVEKLDELAKKFKGYGGTSHVPVFKEIDKRKVNPSVVICFTDLYTEFPKTAPNYPVLWVVSPGGSSAKAPFGRTIRLQEYHKNGNI